jgi:regulator of RNase E activity RraA
MASRDELLRAYDGLRVADVRDGLDWIGLHHYGSVSPAICPLWRTRACGIARTARYLPYEGPDPGLTGAAYTEWSNHYYDAICPYPWLDDLQDGDFVAIDMSGVNAGLMGSHNTLVGIGRGARGYVVNGGVRDTDEIIVQGIPFWSALTSQGMVQTRLQFDAKDVPIAIGGVTIRPGDLIMADGDGVIVVPQRIALEVAAWARRELDRDKQTRREVYEALGRALDDTVQ